MALEARELDLVPALALAVGDHADVDVLVLEDGALLDVQLEEGVDRPPAHLNELSPTSVRGTFPGLAYQLGNLCSSFISPIQAHVAEARGGDYSFSLGVVVAVVAVVLAAVALAGPEKLTAELANGDAGP